MLAAAVVPLWLLAVMPLFRAEAITLSQRVPGLLEASRQQRVTGLGGTPYRFTQAALAVIPEDSTIYFFNDPGAPSNAWRVNYFAYPRRVIGIDAETGLDLRTLKPDDHLMFRGDAQLVAGFESYAANLVTLEVIHVAEEHSKLHMIYRVSH